MDASQELKDLVSMAVCGLCDHPTQVQTEIQQVGQGMFFIVVKCNPEDIKRVIGAKGRNITALRTLTDSVSSKHKAKSVIRVDE